MRIRGIYRSERMDEAEGRMLRHIVVSFDNGRVWVVPLNPGAYTEAWSDRDDCMAVLAEYACEAYERTSSNESAGQS